MMVPFGVIQSDNSPRDIVIQITTDQTALNLKTLFESTHDPAIAGDKVTFNCSESLTFSSNAPNDSSSSFTSPPSITTGSWVPGVNLLLVIKNSEVTGPGGNGNGPNPGAKGGIAFQALSPIAIDGQGSEFAGGGGGGAGTDAWNGGSSGSEQYQAGGGGGAGRPPGEGHIVSGAYPKVSGQTGTATTGGAGGNWGSDPYQPSEAGGGGGNGGARGQNGSNAGDVNEPGSEDNIGGDAGISVSGISNITWISQPTLIGPTT